MPLVLMTITFYDILTMQPVSSTRERTNPQRKILKSNHFICLYIYIFSIDSYNIAQLFHKTNLWISHRNRNNRQSSIDCFFLHKIVKFNKNICQICLGNLCTLIELKIAVMKRIASQWTITKFKSFMIIQIYRHC